MHDRRDEYGRCTRALVADRDREGAAGIFATALTNGLAAIVADRWPGEEASGGRWMKAASSLLDVVEEKVQPAPAGIYVLEDLDPPPAVDVFGPSLEPTPTRIDVAPLREGLQRADVIRHGREENAQPLEQRHIDALAALNDDATLRCLLTYVEDADGHEERVTLADAVERARARDYFDRLSIDEVERRASVDYEDEYLEIDDGERYNIAHERPVCGLEALIEDRRDSYVDEFPAGTCAACSYVKSVEIADLEGRDEAIQRRIDDPRA
jgi:hypothetical protein